MSDNRNSYKNRSLNTEEYLKLKNIPDEEVLDFNENVDSKYQKVKPTSIPLDF